MSKSKAGLIAFLSLAVVVPLAGIHSQESAPSLNDPQLVRIIGAGPAGSDELEQIVDAYVAAGRQDEAADAVARFVIGEYGTPDDHGCDLCIAILSSEATPRRHRHFSVMTAAFDIIEQKAEDRRSGDLLLKAMFNTAIGSGNRHAIARATYYVMRALQIGIDQQMSLSVVQVLHEQGNVEAALELARWLFSSEASAHYDSAVTAAQHFRYAPRVVAGTPVAVPGVRNKIAFVLER